MAEIKIRELSIGDWVEWKVYDKPYVIRITQITDTLIQGVHDGIEYGMLLKQISPIPLTPEILVKNGFDAHGNEYYMYDDGKKHRVYIGNRNKYWNFEHCEFGLGCVFNDMRCELLYTHQLQHALRLAGVEKEIEL